MWTLLPETNLAQWLLETSGVPCIFPSLGSSVGPWR